VPRTSGATPNINLLLIQNTSLPSNLDNDIDNPALKYSLVQ